MDAWIDLVRRARHVRAPETDSKGASARGVFNPSVDARYMYTSTSLRIETKSDRSAASRTLTRAFASACVREDSELNTHARSTIGIGVGLEQE